MRVQTRTGGPIAISAVATLATAGLILGLAPNSARAATETPEDEVANSTDGKLVMPDPDAIVADLDDPLASIEVSKPAPSSMDSGVLTAQATPAESIKKRKVVVRKVRPSFSPNTSRKLGVAQVVTMTFPVDITRKKRVEKHITIVGHKNKKKKVAVKLPPGAWKWTSDRVAVYRPKKFWPGKTTIRYQVNLRGVTVARHGNVRYEGGSHSKFTSKLRTGRSLVLRIRNKTHRMTVIKNGKQVRSFGVSLGKRRYETRSGIKVLTDVKYRVLRMRGTDRYTGEKWDVMSPYSMPLATNGEFIHGAPWARSRMGIRNGSHGCTNMNSEDARWLYNRVRRGDPVVTRGTGRMMAPWMAFTEGRPWVYTWRQWKSG